LPVCSAKQGLGWERFRNSALAEYQNRKIFVSLIEKIFCERAIKKCLKDFSVLLAEAEADGNARRDYSKSASGFCSKKVRISSKK
jgi:hypothetical protein